MRFRLPTHITILIVAVTYVSYLGVRNQLNLYIHPRYIVFTSVMAAIGLLVSLYDGSHKDADHTHSHGSKIMMIPLLLILGAALLLPARTLTSATVSQRQIDSGSIIVASEGDTASAVFAGSSRGLRLRDWSRLLATIDDPSYFANKPATVSGFVYDASLGPDTVWLARFVVTCCAVDAQPVGVPVRLEGWSETYEEDEWLEVEGEFSLQPTADGEEIVLVPVSATKIDQPENPYAN